MKKIVLFIFIILSFLDAGKHEDPSCCSTSWVFDSSGELLPDDGGREPYYASLSYMNKFIEEHNYDYAYDSCTRRYTREYYIYDSRCGNEDCSYTEYSVAANEAYYKCAVCDKEDERYEIPEHTKMVEDIHYDCGASPAEVQKQTDACQAVSGYFFKIATIHCCFIAQCIVNIDDNSTAPDDNSTSPADDDGSSDGDSHPECSSDSYYDNSLGKCQCSLGFIPGNECHNADCSDLECIANPCSIPNSSYNGSTCNCDDGYTPRYGLSLEECIKNPDTNGSDGDDPCSYSDEEGGYKYKGKDYDGNVCLENIKSFGCSRGTFIKHDECSFGACYYNYDLDCPQEDSNDTSSSSSDSDTNESKPSSSETNSSIDSDDTSLLKALNNINDSLKVNSDNIVKSINSNTHILSDKLSILDSTVSNGFNKLHSDLTKPTTTPALSDFEIDKTKQDTIKNQISDIQKQISKSTDLMNKVKAEYSTFFSNVSDSFNSLKDNLSSYQDMFENKPTVIIDSSGSCDLSVTVFGHHIDFGQSLDDSLLLFAPIVKFVLSLVTQLSLIFISIRFFRKD